MSRLRRHGGTLTALAVLCASLLASALVVLWRADAVAAERDASIASAEQYFLGVVDDLEQEVRDTGDRVVFVMRAVEVAAPDPGDSEALDQATRRFGAEDFPGFTGAVAMVDGVATSYSGSIDPGLADVVAAVVPEGDDGPTVDQASAYSVFDADGNTYLAIAMMTDERHGLAFVFYPDQFMIGASQAGDPIVASLSLAAINPDVTRVFGGADDAPADLRSQASLLLGSTEQARFAATRHLSLFGRSWRLAVTSGEGFFRIPNSREAVSVAVLGAVLSLGLFVFTRRIILGREVARREALTQTARFAIGFEGSPIGVLEVDPDFVVTAANAAALGLFGGMDEHQVVGNSILDRFTGESANDAEALLSSPRTDDVTAPDLRVATADGSERWVQLTSSSITGGDGVVGILVQLVDVTEQRAARTELTHMALHDELTQLPNRTLMTDRLERALVRSARTRSMTALMFIDVDLFKEINDTLGHAAGDLVLVELADRMASVLRANDTIARFGGDEFVVLCEDVSSREMASEIAERVRRVVAVPIPFDDKELNVSASIGLAIAEPGDDAEAVLRDADIAMYQAKGAGRGQVVPFEQRMREELVARLEKERHLKVALELDQFELYYQPIVSLRPLGIVGFEALIRWNHPEYGTVAPDEFLGLAERLGLMPRIDRFVLRAGASQAAQWSRAVGRPIGVAVNASAPTIADDAYLVEVEEAIASNGLARGQLTVEMTEQHFVGVKEADRVVPAIRRLGARIAIDDFGTGHSSFAQVAAIPFDVLKLDRSLVTASDTEKGGQIMRTLVQMARALGVSTVAEGVADRATLERIRPFGPDCVQGYLFGRPANAAESNVLVSRMERASTRGAV
ncbi:MAG: EAL domain-containing protein [Acidimicrobiales bacterium]|nr:EAL domain-containing protein [Acidimicrobiales bacterium]